MLKSLYQLYFLIGAMILTTSESSNILFIAHLIGCRSQFNVFEPLFEEMGRRKHDFTVQSYFPVRHPLDDVNLLEIKPPTLVTKSTWSIVDDYKRGTISRFRSFPPFTLRICENFLADNGTSTLLEESKQFDVNIVETLFVDCAQTLAAVIGENIIYLYTSGFFPWLSTAIPNTTSNVSNSLELSDSKKSFRQQMQNGINWLGMQFMGYYELVVMQQTVINKNLPQAPTVLEARDVVAFHLTNIDPIVQYSRQSMPNAAKCGGMYCTGSKSLPKELNDFVESAAHNGFIIFSLGSNIKYYMLKPEFIEAVLSAFSVVRQNIVWEFDGKLKNLPKNVKIVEWMPQQDLLGHTKVSLFITHASLLSLQEAVYYGVPVVAIHMFADQPMNCARVEELGIGECIEFVDLRAGDLFQRITKVINDPKYKKNVKKYSAVFKEPLERPEDKTAFWIESVDRHFGVKHLIATAEHLNFDYFIFDVVTFLIIVIGMFLGVAVYGIHLVSEKVSSLQIWKGM